MYSIMDADCDSPSKEMIIIYPGELGEVKDSGMHLCNYATHY